MPKTIGELKLDDRVVLKDKTYGVARLIGINAKTNQRLIGYKTGDVIPSNAWTNTGGKFIGEEFSGKIKEYTHFYYVADNLELHENEEGSNKYHVGDKVELYCDTNGALTSDSSARDSNQTRQGIVVGFDEAGLAMVYIDKSDLKEIGKVNANNELSRYIHNSFDGSLDNDRGAFMIVDGGSNSIKQISKGKKVRKMSNTTNGSKPAFMEMVKQDATAAAYRVAGDQLINGMKTAILTIMEKNGQGSDRLAALKDLLDTELGSALISYSLGVGLNYVPMISEDPRAQKLSEEFRIGGMSKAGNMIVETALTHFLPVITNALSALPAVEQVRVSNAEKTQEEAVEEEKKTEQKTMTA